jgi:serine/threonine protein kinase
MKLKRDVAFKVLPEAFAGDSGLILRFWREAAVLASLNHPNIAHIYGVEERALVMEFVEGETFSGPLPSILRSLRAGDRRSAGVCVRAWRDPPRSETGQHQTKAKT